VSARAFRDAVRDILREDGVFRLASEVEPSLLWEWDGVEWRRAWIKLPGERRRAG
jgi:hypothetical protein